MESLKATVHFWIFSRGFLPKSSSETSDEVSTRSGINFVELPCTRTMFSTLLHPCKELDELLDHTVPLWLWDIVRIVASLSLFPFMQQSSSLLSVLSSSLWVMLLIQLSVINAVHNFFYDISFPVYINFIFTSLNFSVRIDMFFQLSQNFYCYFFTWIKSSSLAHFNSLNLTSTTISLIVKISFLF